MDAQEHREIRIIGLQTFCDGLTLGALHARPEQAL